MSIVRQDGALRMLFRTGVRYESILEPETVFVVLVVIFNLGL
jgi:hypothetical protein